MDIKELQRRIGAAEDGVFGPLSRQALFVKLTNTNAAALTDSDIASVAGSLGAAPAVIRAVRAVEAPRGAFDETGRPSILFERHKFRIHSNGRFDTIAPALSGPPYKPGGYGSFASQYGKLAAACALNPGAAFEACSWGAFQVLGENAEPMKYASAFDMALELTSGERAHLECFARFVRMKRLEAELRACRAGDPDSCIPFVRGFNGTGFRAFNYHVKLSAAIGA